MTEQRAAVLSAGMVTFSLVACLVLLLIALRGCAWAVSYVPMDDSTLRRGAPAIVIGTVESVAATATEHQVTLRVTEVLKGGQHLKEQRVVLTEPGGTEYFVSGAAEYQPGTDAVVALTRRRGRLTTYQHALGKWTIERGMLWDSATQGRGRNKQSRLLRPFKRVLTDADAVDFPLNADDMIVTAQAPFRLFNNVRWFQPDTNQPVLYRLDAVGDATLGPVASENALRGALAAWTGVDTSSIVLGVSSVGPVTRQGCDGQTGILWNDPYGEIDLPVRCQGVLALGGYCASSETKVVNGTTFRKITEGDIVFADGWASCGFWTEQNVAEVATHEVGHTIGLGHSDVNDATMAAYAHFDGRGASLRPDDEAAVTFVYPGAAVTTRTPIVTRTPTPIATWTLTPTPTTTASVTVSVYVPWETPTAEPTPVPLVVLTDRPAYTPGQRVRVIVQNTPRTRVHLEITHDGATGPVWVRNTTTGSNGIRRLWYSLPYTATIGARYTVTATAGSMVTTTSFVIVAP